MGTPRANHEVAGGFNLQHLPHGLHVVTRKAPVTGGIKVPQLQPLGQPLLDPGRVVGHLPSHKLQPSSRGLVVEEDP